LYFILSCYFIFLFLLNGVFFFFATPCGLFLLIFSATLVLATGGTGDVLTGIITGLLCQRYPPEHAAILGVFVHGLAGDLAAAELSQEAMIAGDVIEYLGKAFVMVMKGER
jgi:NAD(P)H-hydrate epimerase